MIKRRRSIADECNLAAMTWSDARKVLTVTDMRRLPNNGSRNEVDGHAVSQRAHTLSTRMSDKCEGVVAMRRAPGVVRWNRESDYVAHIRKSAYRHRH